MQDEEITTEESLTETEQNVPAPVSEPAVSKVEGLTLDELNAFTGKTFPSKESALKSIKDTYKAVVQRPQPSIDPSQFVSKAEFEEANFYARNPQYESQKERLKAGEQSYHFTTLNCKGMLQSHAKISKYSIYGTWDL